MLPKPSNTPHPKPASIWAIFVRAARPVALWAGAVGMILQVIIFPALAVWKPAALAVINVDVLKILALDVLGLGVLRSIDKAYGRAT